MAKDDWPYVEGDDVESLVWATYENLRDIMFAPEFSTQDVTEEIDMMKGLIIFLREHRRREVDVPHDADRPPGTSGSWGEA